MKLDDLLHELPADTSLWVDALAARADAGSAVAALRDAWLDHHLTPARWASLTGRRVDGATADREIGAIFAELDRRGVPVPWLERSASGETDVRRWCWVGSWCLMSQDEDLLLMSDEWMLPLLDEAAAGCPKRTYVLSVVGHHARDSAHHALWDGAPKARATLARVAEWIDAADRAHAPDLVAYLSRLAGYAEPGPVAREAARQRVLDLRRCSPRAEVEPELARHGDEWVARFDRANVIAGDLHVHAGSGKMRAVERRGGQLVR